MTPTTFYLVGPVVPLRGDKPTVCGADHSPLLIIEFSCIIYIIFNPKVTNVIYIYIYGAPILDVSRSHTTTQHSR